MRTQIVTLKRGITYKDEQHKVVVLREPAVRDYMAAEEEVAVYKSFSFKVAVIARLIEKVEGLPEDAIVTLNMLKALHPKDMNLLFDALDVLEVEEGNE